MSQERIRIGVFFFIFSLAHVTFVMARHAHHLRVQDKDCHSCPPGQGIVHKCNRHHDTKCRPCQPGYYSSHHSNRRPCYPCSRCGSGLYVAHECTPSKDTVCDSCHTYKGPHNEDFYKRCIAPVVPAIELASRSVTSNASSDNHPSLQSTTPPSFPVFSAIVAAVSVCALAVLVTAACFVADGKRKFQKGDSKYSYHAVSTQEVVML